MACRRSTFAEGVVGHSVGALARLGPSRASTAACRRDAAKGGGCAWRPVGPRTRDTGRGAATRATGRLEPARCAGSRSGSRSGGQSASRQQTTPPHYLVILREVAESTPAEASRHARAPRRRSARTTASLGVGVRGASLSGYAIHQLGRGEDIAPRTPWNAAFATPDDPGRVTNVRLGKTGRCRAWRASRVPCQRASAARRRSSARARRARSKCCGSSCAPATPSSSAAWNAGISQSPRRALAAA